MMKIEYKKMLISVSTKKQRESLIKVTANFINEESALESSQALIFTTLCRSVRMACQCVYDETQRGSKSQLDIFFF